MKSGAWVAIGGGGAVAAGVALMAWGFARARACQVKLVEEGSQNPFECVGAGGPFLAGGAILAGLGTLTALTGAGIALVQYSR